MTNRPSFSGQLVSTPGWAKAPLVLAAACCAASFIAPSQARACVFVLAPEYVGFPADGETDVPTDVQLTLDASRLWSNLPGALEAVVLTSTSGTSVEVQLERPYVSSYTITPSTELEPNTLYSLTLSWVGEVEPGSRTIHFTTGDGPFTGTLAPPGNASLQHYKLTRSRDSSCSPLASGTCVALPDHGEVEVRYIDTVGQRHGPYLNRESFFTNLSGIDQGTNFDCIELRTRGPNGTVSEPVVLCGSDAMLLELSDESDVVCTPNGLPVAPESDEGESAGCRISPTEGARGDLLALLAVLAWLRWNGRARTLGSIQQVRA